MNEERLFPDLTPIRHKKNNYIGWIDGITKMKEFFSGNTDVSWQYRICVTGENMKRVAPQEDLEINYDNPTLPTHLEEQRDETSHFRKETILHSLGYQLTDVTRMQREELLLNIAIPYLKLPKVLRTISDLIYSKKQRLQKHINALIEWNYDLDMLLTKYGLTNPEITTEILSYICKVKELLEKQYLKMKISSADIAAEIKNRKKT
ncbi:MAG: hypothetical protein HQL25_04530 [Candidatus Omnitrophica bacterium]|nr:hypothetical protein [Candidatus Omnitrophota bacterium]